MHLVTWGIILLVISVWYQVSITIYDSNNKIDLLVICCIIELQLKEQVTVDRHFS